MKSSAQVAQRWSSKAATISIASLAAFALLAATLSAQASAVSNTYGLSNGFECKTTFGPEGAYPYAGARSLRGIGAVSCNNIPDPKIVAEDVKLYRNQSGTFGILLADAPDCLRSGGYYEATGCLVATPWADAANPGVYQVNHSFTVILQGGPLRWDYYDSSHNGGNPRPQCSGWGTYKLKCTEYAQVGFWFRP